MEWVNFDQINSAGMEIVDIHWGTAQFWREITYMELVALMSGAKFEEAHQAYKEGGGIHGKNDWLLFCLWSVMTFGSLYLFSGDCSAV